MLTPGELSAIAAVLEIRMSPTHPLFLAVLAERDRVTEDAERASEAALTGSYPQDRQVLSRRSDVVETIEESGPGGAVNTELRDLTTEKEWL